MNDNQKVDRTRRKLVVATSVAGGAASLGAAIPFVASMMPSERTKAAGAPIEVDISSIAPGDMKILQSPSNTLWATLCT